MIGTQEYSRRIKKAVVKGGFKVRHKKPQPAPCEPDLPSWKSLAYRAELYVAQAGCCGICFRPLKNSGPVNIDHVQPSAKGGKNIGNIVLAHVRCNTAKGSRKPTDAEKAFLEATNAAMPKPADTTE